MMLFPDRQVGRLCAWSMRLNEGDRPAHGVGFERRPRRQKGGVHNVHTLAVGLGRTGAVPGPDWTVLGMFSGVPSVSAVWNAVRVPPWARFPSSGALWGSERGTNGIFSVCPAWVFYLSSTLSLLCWGSGCVGSWSFMAADSPGDMTCEQRAPDFVSADRVLRIAVSFPVCVWHRFCVRTCSWDSDSGRHDLTMIGTGFFGRSQNSQAMKYRPGS